MKVNWHSKKPLLVFGITLLVVLAIFRIRAWSTAQTETYPAVENIHNASDAIFKQPTNQIIIQYKKVGGMGTVISPASTNQLQRLSEAAGVKITYFREMSGNAHVLRLPDRFPLDQVQRMSEDLMKLPEVEYAEPDSILFPMLTPNDPQYSNQWHYFAPTSSNYGINAPAAWNITTGSAGIVVAVIDTGITNHSEFTGRTVSGYDFITDAMIANDGDGRDSNPSDPGDWITAEESASGYFEGCPVRNSSWHGTHTAGTVGAASNNGVGVAGVNWNSKILPVRVLGKCGGYTSDIIDGSRWAAGLSVSGVPANPNPAKVINLSLGGPGSCGVAWQNAINEIVSVGTTVVVAAGNSNIDAGNYSPASCNNVITVAATNKYGNKATYSNYGSVVEISAPGGNLSGDIDPGVLSTLNTGTTVPVSESYAYYQGTSMAAPHVTGVVSLLYSLNPSLTPMQILSILQSTVTSFPVGSTCNTSVCGSGIVNAGAAVEAIVGIPTLTPTQTSTPGICTNLLNDPSFEAYTPNPYWTEFSTNFGTPLCTTSYCGNGGGTAGPRTGNVWGWFGGTPYSETASLEQSVVIPYGTATLSFYFWIGSAGPGSGTDDIFNVQIDSTMLFSANATQLSSYSGYTLVSVNASAFADGSLHTVRFISMTTGQIVNFNLDDVSLCHGSTVTPTPTTTETGLPGWVYMPLIRRDNSPTPTATNTPTKTITPIPQANVYISNETGGSLCYEVYGSGIGQKCSSSSYFFYGSFPAGNYSFRVSAWCGSLTDTRYYPPGDMEHRFWCSTSAGVDTLSNRSEPFKP